MGDSASLTVPVGDVVSSITTFLYVFTFVYTLTIFLYILTSWLRLPYSPTLNRIQRFLYDVCEPYLRLFRRFIPPLGAFDFSPIIGIFVLYIVRTLVVNAISG